MKIKFFAVFLLFLFTLLSPATKVVINTKDALDVASAASFSNLMGYSFVIIYNPKGLNTYLSKIESNDEIILISPKGKEVYVGLDRILKERGLIVKKIYSDEPINLVLISDLPEGTNFVFTDPAYGYNTVVLLPYARASNSYLVYANETTINDIINLIKGREFNTILLYGTIDEKVKETLDSEGYPFEVIDNGDKILNNIALLKKYWKINNKQEILLFDGLNLEESILVGTTPVYLFSNVVTGTHYSFLEEAVREGKIRYATLVGSADLGTAYRIMKNINKNIGNKSLYLFVKAGKVSLSPGEAATSFEPLDLIPLPNPIVNVFIGDAYYNEVNNAVEVVFRNSGNVLAYVRSTGVVYLNNEFIQSVGSEDIFNVKRFGATGQRYFLTKNLSDKEGNLTLNITVFFGESNITFDHGFVQTILLKKLRYIDKSKLNITKAIYNVPEDKLTIKVVNPGDVPVYAEFYTIHNVSGIFTTVEHEGIYELKAHEGRVITFENLLIDEPDKGSLIVYANYGGKPGFFEKKAEKDVELDYGFPWWILLILLLIALLLYYYWKKKKSRQKIGKFKDKKRKK